MTPRLDLFVPGRPVPQGSKTAFVSKSTGRPIVVDKDVRLPQWRMKVTTYAMDMLGITPPLEGPVGIRIIFTLDRPKSHFGTGKNATKVKPSAPPFPATMPDIDKLIRAILDGLTDARVWLDDGQVVWCQATKVWSDDKFAAGAYLSIGEMQ